MGDAISKSEAYAGPSVLAVSLQEGTKLILNMLYYFTNGLIVHYFIKIRILPINHKGHMVNALLS